jgi:nicotinamide riboside kinase
MKVYFSGAHSTGKSSLSRFTSKKYNLPMLFETARIVLAEQELKIDTLRCDIDVADKYQQDVFDRQLAEEQKYSYFVSDRSLIDVLAYSGNHTCILPKLMKSPALLEYVENLRNQFIFLVSPSKATLSADGVRESLNWDGVVSIHAQIKLLYEMFDLRYFQIDTDNMQERVKLIIAVLSLVKS